MNLFPRYREVRRLTKENEALKKELAATKKELEYQKGLTWKQAGTLTALLHLEKKDA